MVCHKFEYDPMKLFVLNLHKNHFHTINSNKNLKIIILVFNLLELNKIAATRNKKYFLKLLYQ